MKENFKKSLDHILVYEGGFINHKKDKGGATLNGITQKVYDAYRRDKGLEKKILTSGVAQLETWKAERDEIYRIQYWDRVRGDDLPNGIDFMVFDGAVNSGVAQSIKWLQRALGVSADGSVGEITLAALKKELDHDLLCERIYKQRLAFLKRIKAADGSIAWDTFGKGWLRRINNVLQNAQSLASDGKIAATDPVHTHEGAHKAFLKDAEKAPSTAPGDLTTGAGLITTILGIVSEATAALRPVAEASPTVGAVVTVLTVIGPLLLIGGIAYRTWARTQTDQINSDLDLTPNGEVIL